MGKRISKPITISLQPEVFDMLEDLAAEAHMTRSAYITQLILDASKKKIGFMDKVKNIFK